MDVKNLKTSVKLEEKKELDSGGQMLNGTVGFGTRKNPNRSMYDPKKYSGYQMEGVDQTVLSEPTKSVKSDKIFADCAFHQLGLNTRTTEILKKSAIDNGFGFLKPTNVQVKSIPVIVEGNDALIKSETGSGKTLAYLIPAVERLIKKPSRVGRGDGTLAIILAPTRELCQQIFETLQRLLKPYHYLVAGIVSGGEKKKSEKARLRKGVNILVATPGRLVDHMTNTCSFDYTRVEYLVLDEADRLLDMGFEKQISSIIEALESKKEDKVQRQNILVSATLSKGVQKLASYSLQNPIQIDADENSNHDSDSKLDSYSTPHQLVQHFMVVSHKQRLSLLACFIRSEILYGNGNCKVVVFFSTCDSVDFHYSLFCECSWPDHGKSITNSNLFSDGGLFRLHGNIPQKERLQAFQEFSKSNGGILFCTDVAARGVNLPTVNWIIQYDAPSETRDYVHRVGRTCRSGNQGNSLLFVLPSEQDYLNYLKKHNLSLTALSTESSIKRAIKNGEFKSSYKKSLQEVVVGELQYLFEQRVLGSTDLYDKSCQAFHSYVRSYATHSSDTKYIFNVRGLHFGHVAKSFGLRDPPASDKLKKASFNAQGSMLKRKVKIDEEKDQRDVLKRKEKLKRRKYTENLSEFAE